MHGYVHDSREPIDTLALRPGTPGGPPATGFTVVEPPSALRDQFAMAALSALIARHRADVAWSEIAPRAYEIADAMLKERVKGT